MNSKQRIDFIDLAKGICISLVVLSHVYMGDHPKFLHIQDYFRMPLYFILSGLFFKQYTGFVDFALRKTNKLIIPLLSGVAFFSLPLLYYLKHRAGQGVVFPDDFWQQERLKFIFQGNCTLWFLWCLFLVNVFFYAIHIICRNKTALIILLCLSLGIASFWLGKHGCFLPLWSDAAMTALPFFMAGYMLRHHSNILYEPFKTKHWAIALGAFIAIVAIYLYDSHLATGYNVIIHGDNHFEISCFSMYAGGLSGTLMILMISKRIKQLPIISYIGRYSIVVLITHLVLIYILRITLYHFSFAPQYLDLFMIAIFTIIILAEIPIIHIAIRYLPYMFAQKDLIKPKADKSTTKPNTDIQ